MQPVDFSFYHNNYAGLLARSNTLWQGCALPSTLGGRGKPRPYLMKDTADSGWPYRETNHRATPSPFANERRRPTRLAILARYSRRS